MIDENLLRAGAERFGVSLTDRHIEQFQIYANFLVEYNQKVNLTAVTDPEGIVVKHFVDSLALLNFCPISEGAVLADVGAGAGFPSLPIAIVRGDVRATLIDSLNKRILFLNELFPRIGVKNADAVHMRAEEAGKNAKYREHYDVVTARAVAKLPMLCEYCMPLVKIGGVFAALKGPDLGEEMEHSKNAIAALDGELLSQRCYQLPDGSGRTAVVIKKIGHTPPQYPRNPDKIAKKPL